MTRRAKKNELRVVGQAREKAHRGRVISSTAGDRGEAKDSVVIIPSSTK
jgi:cyanophycinase-like exopeptidase